MAKPYVRQVGELKRAGPFTFTSELKRSTAFWRADSTAAKWDFATREPPASSRLH